MGLNKIRSFWIATIALFVLSVGFGLHGYSLSAWWPELGEPIGKSLVRGHAQGIRSDDWQINIPSALSQISQPEALSANNPVYGYPSTRVLMHPNGVPVAHWSVFFRPQTWGYFVGPDFGISWQWNFQVMGLFVAVFWLAHLLSQQNFGVSLFSAAAIVASPFFQFWSFNSAFVALSGCFALVSLHSLIHATSRRQRALLGACLSYGLIAFGLVLYPPYQIALSYLGVFVGFAWLAAERKSPSIGQTIGSLAACAFVVALSLAAFLRENANEIALQMNTAYPGHRTVLGGTDSLSALFGSLFFLDARRSWISHSNICEMAKFYFLFPWLTLFVILAWKRLGQDRAVAVALIMYCALATAWHVVSLPTLAAQISGLSLVPPVRAVIGIGIANILLVAWFLGNVDVRQHMPDLIKSWLVWVLFVFGIGYTAHQAAPEIRPLEWLATGTVAALVPLGLSLKPQFSMAALSVVIAGSTLWFNPIERNSAQALRKTEVISRVLEAQKQMPGRWITLGSSALPNLLRAFGVPIIDGVQIYPHFDLWKVLDPSNRFTQQVNRYAHLSFEASSGETQISNPGEDQLLVRADFDAHWPVELDVQHLLCRKPCSQLTQSKNWRPVQQLKNFEIWDRSKN